MYQPLGGQCITFYSSTEIAKRRWGSAMSLLSPHSSSAQMGSGGHALQSAGMTPVTDPAWQVQTNKCFSILPAVDSALCILSWASPNLHFLFVWFPTRKANIEEFY